MQDITRASLAKDVARHYTGIDSRFGRKARAAIAKATGGKLIHKVNASREELRDAIAAQKRERERE